MIIGINGKIGSGKDTIGNIIQFLICMQKMTLADYQAKTLESFILAPRSNEIQSGWEIKKFAGKLKTIGSLLSGVPVEMFEDQEFKQKYMSEEWNNPNPVIYENGNKAWMPMTYREFLQKLGTEAMRDGLHTNVWVNALFADYKAGDPEYDAFYPNWIITDMRFPNEMEAVVERKGITIKVIRDTTCPECGVTGGHKMYVHKDKSLTDLHPSETALDDAEFDYEIINDGTIEDLVEKVKEILIKESII